MQDASKLQSSHVASKAGMIYAIDGYRLIKFTYRESLGALLTIYFGVSGRNHERIQCQLRRLRIDKPQRAVACDTHISDIYLWKIEACI